MSDCELTLADMRNIGAYLAKFPTSDQKSAAVELLISKAISFMFHLPFFTSETDKTAVEHKVVWNGKGDAKPVCGPPNGSDTNVYARHYDILIEVTQRKGANQWKFEFGTGLRHIQDYIKKTGKTRDQTYLFLIAPKIHVDTYNSVRQKVIEGENIILLTFNDLESLVQTCNLTIGLRHVDLANLMERFSRCMVDYESLTDYETKHKEILIEWRKSFLRNDRLTFLGIKGYKVFKEKHQPMMTASDILTELITEEDVKLYFEIVGQMPKRDDVCSGMLMFGFAYEIGLPSRDPILSVASALEIEKRMKEILDSITES